MVPDEADLVTVIVEAELGSEGMQSLLHDSEDLFPIPLGNPHLFLECGEGEFFVRTSPEVVNHLWVAEYDHLFSFQCNLERCTAVLEGTI